LFQGDYPNRGRVNKREYPEVRGYCKDTSEMEGLKKAQVKKLTLLQNFLTIIFV
jgi:hypothetical protein